MQGDPRSQRLVCQLLQHPPGSQARPYSLKGRTCKEGISAMMLGDPPSQRPISNTLQARKLARPPSVSRQLSVFADDFFVDRDVLSGGFFPRPIC